MTKETWAKRQAQWRRFHEWEAANRTVPFSPAERLAEIGALVDRALNARRGPVEASDVTALARRVRVMQTRLAVLGRVP
ncbi:MAG: hypothetical protein HYZ92_06285 [Candidatus Omnitrophica bacterium]|nr:hypothetical protein [Candidatus Omnitrophota bacterium]